MDGHIIIGTELDTKDFDSQITYIEKQMEEIEDKLKKADMGFEVGDTIKLEAQYEKLSNRLSELIRKKEELNKKDLSKMQKSIEGVGDSVSGVIKKMGKWALAVFGIRSAYMFVRQAMSTLSQYNDQMATDVEYIRYLLASTLQPVIETLIQLAYKLLTYINFIAKAWFGVDLFANASADAFNKNKQALAGASKNAKELQKTLTGFDKVNILQDNGQTSSGGGGGGVSMPSFPTPEDVPIPSWVQWIADNGELVIAILGGIAAGLLAIHFGASLIMGLGIGIAIAGLIILVQSIIDFINDPSWENFANILKGLAILLTGVAIAMIAVNAANPVAWILLAIALIAALVALIIENWDKIKEVLGKVGAWIYDHIIKPVGDFFKGLWDGIVNGFNAAIEWIKTTFNNVVNFFKGIINTIVTLFKNIGTKVGNVIGGAFKGVINGVLSAIENILNFPIRSINGLIGVINAIPGINLGKLSTFKLPRLAKGGILNMPGRGVNYYGAANIAERGREGVVPLDNEASLRIIGETIAKNTKFNADITLELEGRILARVMEEINANRSFARNGG